LSELHLGLYNGAHGFSNGEECLVLYVYRDVRHQK